MNPFSALSTVFSYLAAWFGDLAMWCYNNYIFQGFYPFLSGVTNSCNSAAWNLVIAANDWASLWQRAADIISWPHIQESLLAWFPWLLDLGAWFATWLWHLQTAIDTWWDGTQTAVVDWITISIATALDNLPGFLSLEGFTAWWGQTGVSFASWWEASRTGVLEAVETTLAPIRETVNAHAGAIELLTSPGDVALRWFWDRLTTAIVRLW